MAGENPTAPVPIVLDRPRTLRFNIAAVRRIRSEKGPKYFDEPAEGEDELERLTYLAVHGLLHEDPELTQEQLEELVDFRQVHALGQAIARALEQDVPAQAKEVAPGQPGPQKRAGRKKRTQ
jgi:hypothetical protein